MSANAFFISPDVPNNQFGEQQISQKEGKANWKHHISSWRPKSRRMITQLVQRAISNQFKKCDKDKIKVLIHLIRSSGEEKELKLGTNKVFKRVFGSRVSLKIDGEKVFTHCFSSPKPTAKVAPQ